MCYRCSVCDKVQEPKTPLRLHAFYREVPRQKVVIAVKSSPVAHDTLHARGMRLEIASEIPVCAYCGVLLSRGHTVKQVRQMTREESEPKEVLTELLAPVPMKPPEPVKVVLPRKVLQKWRQKNGGL